MSNAFITELKSLLAKFEAAAEPEIKVVEQEALDIGKATLAYIKTNGLADLIALAKAALLGAATGTPYTATLAAVEAQAETAGIALAKGASAVVVAAVQADLVALEQIPAPVAAPAV